MKPYWVISILVLIYLGIMLFSLYPNLDMVMRPAVILYGIIISAMLICASGLKLVLDQSSYRLLVTGAFLFVLSDSKIAYNKFLFPIPFSGFWIMLTYILAQFLIMENIIKNH